MLQSAESNMNIINSIQEVSRITNGIERGFNY
jgi:hypothetical protein